MKQKLAFWCLCLIAGLAGRLYAASDSGKSHHDFVVQTHRCAGALGPENTLESCYFAWMLGTIPEVDVRTTADGVMVAFHDKDFQRVVKTLPDAFKNQGVEAFCFDTLQILDVGAYKGAYFEGQRIPSIKSIFEEMQLHPDYQLYLDVKDVSLEALAELAQAYGLGTRVILASTHYEWIHQWSSLLDGAQTLLWMGGAESKLRERIDRLRSVDFEGITQLQIHVKQSDESDVGFTPSPAFLKEVDAELESRGILFQSLPWMADSEIYQMLLDLGVDSFATDYPQITIRAMNRNKKN